MSAGVLIWIPEAGKFVPESVTLTGLIALPDFTDNEDNVGTELLIEKGLPYDPYGVVTVNVRPPSGAFGSTFNTAVSDVRLVTVTPAALIPAPLTVMDVALATKFVPLSTIVNGD